MTDPTRRHVRQTIIAALAFAVALSAIGPVGIVSAQPSVSVSQSADTTTVAPGDSVTFTTEFTVAELNAPQLQATLPSGWEIETQTASGPAAYNDGTWTWLAGDNDGVNVSYTVEYTVSVPADAEPGDYTVSVEGDALSPDDSSETADSAATTITVAEPDQNEAPSASFTASPDSPEAGESVSFDASASNDSDGSIASYEWQFGDGETATGATPSHTYDSPGDYTVTLTVTDDDGATATATETVSVSEAPEPANFQLSNLNVASPVTQGDAATVTATVENTGDESGTATVSVSVDGSQADSESVTLPAGASQQVTFAVDTTGLSVGDHDVTVATDDDSETATLTVAEQPPANQDPSAAFSPSPAAPETGETVTFDASASNDPDGTIASYEWSFGDGETATGATPTHTYDSPGDYTVTLTVTDDDGATASATQTVTVSEPAPPEPDLSTAVSLSPSEELVAVNGSTTFDVVVENVDGGVGAYSLSVSLSNDTAASITNVSVDEAGLTDVQITDGGATANVDAALLDTAQNGSVTVATVTVAGDAAGVSDVELTVESLGTEAGTAYNVTTTEGATLTVSELVVGPSGQPAQDLDDDGVYEDVNGDGVVNELDVQVLFGARNDEIVQNTPEAFDFNGDGEFDILDVQALYYEEVA